MHNSPADVVHNILCRAINHMEARDQYPDPQDHKGVETVTFSTSAERLGKVDHLNFESQWRRIQHRVVPGEFPPGLTYQHKS